MIILFSIPIICLIALVVLFFVDSNYERKPIKKAKYNSMSCCPSCNALYYGSRCNSCS